MPALYQVGFHSGHIFVFDPGQRPGSLTKLWNGKVIPGSSEESRLHRPPRSYCRAPEARRHFCFWTAPIRGLFKRMPACGQASPVLVLWKPLCGPPSHSTALELRTNLLRGRALHGRKQRRKTAIQK